LIKRLISVVGVVPFAAHFALNAFVQIFDLRLILAFYIVVSSQYHAKICVISVIRTAVKPISSKMLAASLMISFVMMVDFTRELRYNSDIGEGA